MTGLIIGILIGAIFVGPVRKKIAVWKQQTYQKGWQDGWNCGFAEGRK